jgi:hypothetical protein
LRPCTISSGVSASSAARPSASKVSNACSDPRVTLFSQVAAAERAVP